MTAANDTPPINAAQLRVMDLIEALAGYEIGGRRLTDIAAAIGSSLPMALRDLRALAAKGWAERIEDGRWRLGTKPVQISLRYTAAMRLAQERLAETEQRYTRTPT